MKRLVAMVGTLAAITLPSLAMAAGDPAAKEELTRELTAKVPGNWQLHVRWRDKMLLASIMPPYQEAFDLWYDPSRQLAVLERLCPSADDRIWQRLAADQDIVLEPTVGGKTANDMRVSCRKLKPGT